MEVIESEDQLQEPDNDDEADEFGDDLDHEQTPDDEKPDDAEEGDEDGAP